MSQMQSQWKRIHEKATGALPVATLTKWGAALIALLLAAFLLTQSRVQLPRPEEVETVATGTEEPAGPGAQAQVAARVREEGLRQEAQRQAAERDLQRRRELGITTPNALPLRFCQAASSAAIRSCRRARPKRSCERVLRLEEIERRNRSLRSAPVAQTYRILSDTPTSQAAEDSAAPRISTGEPTAQDFQTPIGQTFQNSLEMFREAVSDLEDIANRSRLGGGADRTMRESWPCHPH